MCSIIWQTIYTAEIFKTNLNDYLGLMLQLLRCLTRRQLQATPYFYVAIIGEELQNFSYSSELNSLYINTANIWVCSTYRMLHNTQFNTQTRPINTMNQIICPAQKHISPRFGLKAGKEGILLASNTGPHFPIPPFPLHESFHANGGQILVSANHRSPYGVNKKERYSYLWRQRNILNPLDEASLGFPRSFSTVWTKVNLKPACACGSY